MKRRNLFKKSLSVLLGMALVIAVLATGTIGSVQAEEATSGSCGEKVTWSLDDDTLTISGTGAMTNYFYAYPPWYGNRSSITSVVIGNEVTTIGDSAFYDCSRLTSIKIPESVITIGDHAFSGCVLTSITIPYRVTTIGDSAFYFCNSLTSIEIPESVETIGDFAFASCSSLETIYLPSRATIGSSAIPDTAWQITYEVVGDENKTIHITEIIKGTNTSDDITIPDTIGGYLCWGRLSDICR